LVFSSLTFLFAFFPITLLLYFGVPKAFRNVVLMIMSLIFYAWGEPVYIAIMIFAMFFDYTNGRLIEKYRDNKRKCRIIFINFLVVTLTILGSLK
jgi:alginate O-acetyltransferase complex protein AlgI